MKKLITLILVIGLVLSCTACGEEEQSSETIKVGMVCIGDSNQAYDRNFISAATDAKEILSEKGIEIEWVYKYNYPDGEKVTEANIELAEAGCIIVYNNSYGQEPYMLTAAADYPDVQFVSFTNEASAFDDLDNTHNAFVRIYEGRYLTGVVAGLKINEMIANGEITAEEAKLGYVGAYSFAEVISGFSAYYLGAKSVCPSVTMDVSFVGSWGDATLEAQAASSLLGGGAIIISQHSDNTTPATTAQDNRAYHTGYNVDMRDVAPYSSLVSTRIDWTDYFVESIETVVNGGNFAQDYCTGLAEGTVIITPLNEAIVPEGTREVLEEAVQGIINGTIKVFDTSTFTVNGEHVSHAFALDTNGDWVADSEEAIIDGAFVESYYKSAPYFDLKIDGITWMNAAY